MRITGKDYHGASVLLRAMTKSPVDVAQSESPVVRVKCRWTWQWQRWYMPELELMAFIDNEESKKEWAGLPDLIQVDFQLKRTKVCNKIQLNFLTFRQSHVFIRQGFI